MASDLFRVYTADECGKDGYPCAWHETIKHEVRAREGHRCIRCGHPYTNGEHGNGEWSPCDASCSHSGPVRARSEESGWVTWETFLGEYNVPGVISVGVSVEAQWRILTVHHLNGHKTDCRWWNLVPLCQRCHLRVQRVVVMDRVYPWPHSSWFKPYVAAFYASTYLGEELTRDEVTARLDELLALELQAA